MRKSIAGILSAVVLLTSTLVWYSCTKDAEETTGDIYGTVTDLLTSEPIGGVNVKLMPSGEATLTGSDGTYEFRDLKPDNYSLFLSKATYADLEDDYIITVVAGKKTKRDVQMSKQVASLRITDMGGNNITELDFGIEESITTKSFNIFNNGSLNITCEITYSCAWITSVTPITNPITPGQTVTITVSIDRTRLSGGANSTMLHVVSNNGSNELRVLATGIDLPTVSTANITNIAASTATCGGNVSADGGSYVTDRGICWATTNAPTVDNNHVAMGQGTGTFSCNMTNLEPGTTYYVRAYAVNNRGTAYGEQKQFTSSNGLPTISTNAVSNIGATSAQCGGSITNNGGFNVTARGICWNTVGNPDINGDHTTNGTGNGTFTASMTNLTPSTTYHVRAYATNRTGTVYGSERTFTTTNGLPTVTVNNVSNVTPTSAVCGGNVTNNGGFAVTEKGLVWSTAPYPTLSDNHASFGSGNGSFTGSMTGLSLGTTYYVRAYATNSQGTAYSSTQYNFTTGNGLPTVTTTNVTVSGGSVVSGGNVTSDGGYPVTARGICYGVYPNPDLSGAYTHTTDGSGTGYYTSIIDTTLGTELYVRAYATNANGTSYGEQIVMNLEYLRLPTFSYNGHTYRVAPDPHTSCTQYISWVAANTYCENLTAYGYSDWRMPTQSEMETMYQNRNNIGGFIYYATMNTDVGRYRYHPKYHTSTISPDQYHIVHIVINWEDGSAEYNYIYETDGWTPHTNANLIRDHCHVRPIRMEN